MATFEVTIESADVEPMRLVVEADNWVAAWHDGLRQTGTEELPEDAVCAFSGEGVVNIEVPSQARRFVVRHLMQRQAGGLVKKPRKAAAARAPDAATTPDPIAKVLSDLERQRLLSRPVRISSSTGLPMPHEAKSAARQLTPLTVPRAASHKKLGTGATHAFSEAPTEQLPQQFHPVQPDDLMPDSLDEALQWAAETAWKHVPCALALVLSSDDGRIAEIGAARGEREREVRGCRVACDAGPAQLVRSASLTRFAAAQPLRFEGVEGDAWERTVTSVLAVPIVLLDGELTGLSLLLLDSPRASGFAQSELRAVIYLARTLASRL